MQTPEERFTPPAYGESERDLGALYPSLGRAISHWALLENQLATWLSLVSAMPLRMAKDIFFSANSFNGRVDIVLAAIENSTASDADRLFLETVLHKAEDYSKFRNRFVHGLPLVKVVGEVRTPVIIHPYGGNVPEKVKEAITAEMLDIAANNFARLTDLMMQAHFERVFRAKPPHRDLSQAQREELLKQVELLPNEPQSSGQSKHQRGRERQREVERWKLSRPQNKRKGS
jgi:hypothetical protein